MGPGGLGWPHSPVWRLSWCWLISAPRGPPRWASRGFLTWWPHFTRTSGMCNTSQGAGLELAQQPHANHVKYGRGQTRSKEWGNRPYLFMEGGARKLWPFAIIRHSIERQRYEKILEHRRCWKQDQSGCYVCDLQQLAMSCSMAPLHLITLTLFISFSTACPSAFCFLHSFSKTTKPLYDSDVIRTGKHGNGNTSPQAVQPRDFWITFDLSVSLSSHNWPLPSPVDTISAILPCPRSTSPAEDSCANTFCRISAVLQHLRVIVTPWAAPFRFPCLCVLICKITTTYLRIRVDMRIKWYSPHGVFSPEPSTAAHANWMQPTLCRLSQFILLISQIVSPAQTTQGVPQRRGFGSKFLNQAWKALHIRPCCTCHLACAPLKIPCSSDENPYPFPPI